MAGNPRDKYCIVGVGETEYSRASGRTTRAMGAEAIRNAMNDAGLTPGDIDGMLSYHGGDSTPATSIQYDLGIRPNFYMDCSGGGSSTEALVGLAIGAIEAGMCDTVAIFRSMNGYSNIRIGGTGARASAPIGGMDLMKRPYGLISAVVAHTVIPSFRDLTPFAIVLVELDEQRGQPDEHDGLRITGNLMDANFDMEKEENVGIGKRVEACFLPVEDGFKLLQWRLIDEPAQGFTWAHQVPEA
ncbi:hypothetical protein GBAR_LOCUS16514 [Geodia barretti]|uniref:ChsH2 C-terminal OB-fold domain-containing protein n=1 Tax=Geodia barretti TaxID=519541 RepID=A0AA35SHZ6_GEOBA|nr:hypothetical protein GBAR_LOCUS16514 [Geodia barretti]